MHLGDIGGQIAAIVGALAAVYGVYLAVRSDARKRAAQDLADRKQITDDAYAAGVRSQAAALSLLTVQLGDARKERDTARKECDVAVADSKRWEDRYNDLRDGKAGR